MSGNNNNEDGQGAAGTPPHASGEEAHLADFSASGDIAENEGAADAPGNMAGERAGAAARQDGSRPRSPQDLEAVFDVPVRLAAILGRSRMQIADLVNLDAGAILELDRKVGEAIDICINDKLVARGEVVLVDDKLGVTMTEIIKADRH